MQFLHNSSLLLKSFWFIAVPISLMFLVQTLVFLTGLDVMDQSENYNSILNEEDSAFHFFSLKSLIHFLFSFSWTGIFLYSFIEEPLSLFILSVTSGILFVFLCAYIIKKVQLLRIDNSFKIQHAVNQNAEVYLTIPENKNGKGKIKVAVKGFIHELEAITENNQIESGTLVKVEKIADNTLVVKSLKGQNL
ncbi:NfeD family protein [Flavobacterium artemisiae]|uniref:NfeD family protein n=1 Tax=Flavobacterium artemisiae TaxID=2126556 RepID=A0ABW4H9M7_9FLAO